MKISILTLAFNDEDTIDMWLNNTLAIGDEVIIVDGGSTDLTTQIVKQFIKEHPAGAKIKLINGPQKNPEAYKQQIKDRYGRILQNGSFGEMKQIAYEAATGDWVLFLDADECISDNFKEIMEKVIPDLPKCDSFNLQYIHFIGDLRKVDNSEAVHNGLLRCHKNVDYINYKGRYNHALPNGCKNTGTIFSMIIFHLGYARNMFDIHKRYKRNMIYSEIHFGLFQCYWRDQHYFEYPTKDCPIPPSNYPQALKERFEIGVYKQTMRGEFNPEEAKQ